MHDGEHGHRVTIAGDWEVDDVTEIDSVPVLDAQVLGRRLRAARVLAGYDGMDHLRADLERTAGICVSSRVLYGLERGEQHISLELFIAWYALTQPPDGMRFFANAIRADVLARMRP